MARARNIKPGFYKNEDLAECSVWARFIFPGLWMLADRDGLLEDRPKRIKGELLPFDSQDVEPLLEELARFKLIIRYKNADGSFICIPKFKAHQTPHYSEKPSGIKPPPLSESENLEAGNFQEPSENTPGALQEKGRIKRGSQPPESLLLIPDSGILDPESNSPPDGGSLGRASTPPAKRKTRLPGDFTLTPERRASMTAANPAADPAAEFAKFRDHHTAHGSTMLDWDAAWRTWCANSVRFGPRAVPRQSSLLEHNVAAMQEFIANGTD